MQNPQGQNPFCFLSSKRLFKIKLKKLRNQKCILFDKQGQNETVTNLKRSCKSIFLSHLWSWIINHAWNVKSNVAKDFSLDQILSSQLNLHRNNKSDFLYARVHFRGLLTNSQPFLLFFSMFLCHCFFAVNAFNFDVFCPNVFFWTK